MMKNVYIIVSSLTNKGELSMDKLTKEEYFQLDNGTIQDITRKFIEPHILANQSHLISDMQKEAYSSEIGYWFSDDNIENLYLSDDEIIKYYLDDIELEEDSKEITSEMLDNFRSENPKEIFEWYLVSDWFMSRLYDIKEPIISNEYGSYWGRCCTGQSIYVDYNIQELAWKFASDNRLYKDEEVA